MALFKIFVKHSGRVNGVRLEEGMFVEWVSNTPSDPMRCNLSRNKAQIAQMFQNKYGLDLQGHLDLINTGHFDTERIS
ncbi:MAG: DUF6140 family protein [Paludibacteraceae bacterium]